MSRIAASFSVAVLIVVSGFGLLLCGIALGVGLAIVALTMRLQDLIDG